MASQINETSILSGPEKWDLSAGLFDRKQHRRVYFILDSDAEPYCVRITSVQAANDSGNNWNIEGLGVRNDSRLAQKRVFIRYATNTRTGSLKFLED